jgi:sporulation protein YtfJ
LDKKKKIDSILEKTAEQLTGLIDVNTVIGKPVFSASGAQIIPFTKVTMGYLSGGGEYGEVKAIKDDEVFPFAGGAGTVINIKPSGFLIDDGKECRLVRVTDDPLDGIIEKASDLVGKMIRKTEENEE